VAGLAVARQTKKTKPLAIATVCEAMSVALVAKPNVVWLWLLDQLEAKLGNTSNS